MKKYIDEILREEYKTYAAKCKKPMPFLEWASHKKENMIRSLKRQLELWENVMIRVENKN